MTDLPAFDHDTLAREEEQIAADRQREHEKIMAIDALIDTTATLRTICSRLVKDSSNGVLTVIALLQAEQFAKQAYDLAHEFRDAGL